MISTSNASFPSIRRRRALGAAFVAAVVLASGSTVTAVDAATAEPKIAFLNPSSFATRPGVGVIVSPTRPNRPAQGAVGYRISVWADTAPTNGGVEIELLKNGVTLETMDAALQPRTQDSYYTTWNIPSTLPDGPYTLRATLFENNEGITYADQEIVLVRTADRSGITYPGIGTDQFPSDGSFGTFAPLRTALTEGETGRALPVGNIDGNYTANSNSGTSFVRAFYTVSEPGTEPEWIVCGTDAAAARVSSAANDGVRCTLQDLAHQTQVSAVATVANNTPYPLAFDPAHNAAGDAVRVFEPYAQEPTRFEIVSGEIGEVTLNEEGAYGCQTVAFHLRDQRGREVTGANVDAHAAGPGNGLRFDTGLFSPAGFQAPDRQAHILQPGYDCLGANSEVVEDQGSHRVYAGPDTKHIETSSGTSDSGRWAFALWSPTGNVTPERWTARWTAWVDESDDLCGANDDRFTHEELHASGLVGFGKAATYVPPFTPSDLQMCVPDPDGPVTRELTMSTDRNAALAASHKVTLFGELVSAYPACMHEQPIKLKWRRPGKRFRTIADAVTSETGTFEGKVKAKVGRNEYRAVAPKSDTCLRARSAIAKVRGY